MLRPEVPAERGWRRMSLLYPAGQTPYLTEPELTSAPTGISWSTIPSGSQVTEQQRIAERINILGRATGRADGYVNQVLRATVDYDQQSGPDYRVTVQVGSGNGRMILTRWPILSITSVLVTPNNVFPRQWTTLPAGYYDIEHPVSGLYGSVAPTASGGDGGQSVLISAGYVNWCNGRNGVLLRISYINGWPHTSLTAVAAPSGVVPRPSPLMTAPAGRSRASSASRVRPGSSTTPGSRKQCRSPPRRQHQDRARSRSPRR